MHSVCFARVRDCHTYFCVASERTRCAGRMQLSLCQRSVGGLQILRVLGGLYSSRCQTDAKLIAARSRYGRSSVIGYLQSHFLLSRPLRAVITNQDHTAVTVRFRFKFHNVTSAPHHHLTISTSVMT